MLDWPGKPPARGRGDTFGGIRRWLAQSQGTVSPVEAIVASPGTGSAFSHGGTAGNIIGGIIVAVVVVGMIVTLMRRRK